MWEVIQVYWAGFTADMQAAVLGAIATIVAASIGIGAIVWQIGRQAQHAIKQNRLNEALKLKMRVYEEINSVCRAASEAELDVSSFIRKFETDVLLYKAMTQHGQSWTIPTARFSALNELKHELSGKLIAIISLTERWQIVDPRMELIRVAMSVAIHDIGEDYKQYLEAASFMMPVELSGEAISDTLVPWNLPNDESLERLQQVGKEVLDTLMDSGSYIYDIQIEMQNLLLGDLFNGKVPPREPLDPQNIVLRLDHYDELIRYFNNETSWGKYKNNIEEETRANFSGES